MPGSARAKPVILCTRNGDDLTFPSRQTCKEIGAIEAYQTTPPHGTSNKSGPGRGGTPERVTTGSLWPRFDPALGQGEPQMCDNRWTEASI